MSRSLQEVVDALARAGVLIDAPDTRVSRIPEITGLTADARRLERGMLFCAVRGAVLDGHNFVADAAARGAAAAVVEVLQRSPSRRSWCATVDGPPPSPPRRGIAGRRHGCR